MKSQIDFELFDESTRKKTKLKSGDTLCIMRSNGTAGFFRQGTRLLGDGRDDKMFVDGDSVITMLRHFGIMVTKYDESGGSVFYRIGT